MIRKAVIPAAGLGTRLLPITKEFPKEMLPVFFRQHNKICVMPMLEAIFEQLFDVGFRQFCFIVGRGKRAIEDHFTQDWGFIQHLKDSNKGKMIDALEHFYKRLTESTIVFVNQPEPRGFGDSVLCAKAFTGREDFLVHAGDDLVLSKDSGHIKKLLQTFRELQADAAVLVEKVDNPRSYGVIEGMSISDGIYKVKRIEEKPTHPSSHLVTIAIYAFRYTVHAEIAKVKPDKRGEIQLTDAIQCMIDQGREVYAIEVKEEKRIDVGTTKGYWNALKTTYKFGRIV